MSADAIQAARRPGREAGTAAARRREISSEELLGGGHELRIRHAHQIYTLRRTSKGKLILTK